MKKIFFISLVLLVTGCANVAQTGSVSQAYKSFAANDYKKTLELITQAELFSTTTPELKAELTYLKAQALEEMGQSETAETLYEYLTDQHKDSQYGYLAAKWFEKKDESIN